MPDPRAHERFAAILEEHDLDADGVHVGRTLLCALHANRVRPQDIARQEAAQLVLALDVAPWFLPAGHAALRGVHRALVDLAGRELVELSSDLTEAREVTYRRVHAVMAAYDRLGHELERWQRSLLAEPDAGLGGGGDPGMTR